MRAKVGMFDSGIGGLTVLGECLRVCENTDFYYYGDNGNAPYGSRSEEDILRLTRYAAEQFDILGVHAVVLACNTATAVCAEKLRREFSFPVIGLEPAVNLAGKFCKNALVLATPRTAESARLRNLIEGAPNCNFTVCGLPYAAGEIEKRFTERFSRTERDDLCGTDGGRLAMQTILCGGTFPQEEFDGIVLGCSHYSYFKKEFSEHFGTRVFDGNRGVAKRLKCVLRERMTTDERFAPDFTQKTMLDFSDLNTGRIFSGKLDHSRPRTNPNIRFLKIRNNRSFFLGKWGEINHFVFISNVCFKQK